MEGANATPKKLHPLLATAAVAVTVASVLGAIALISSQASGTGAGRAGQAAAGLPPPPSGVPPGPPPDLAAPPAPVCADCGTVADVRLVRTPGQGSGVGAVAGGVVGGLVGHEFGRGSGRDAMSVLGVVGGALAGNEVEKQARATSRYEVDVRLDNGRFRTVALPGNPGPIVGMRVRIEHGHLVRAG